MVITHTYNEALAAWKAEHDGMEPGVLSREQEANLLRLAAERVSPPPRHRRKRVTAKSRESH